MTNGQEDFLKSKTAGILVPLFSLKGENDWGIGDFAVLESWLKYFADLGAAVVQILPINEMGPYQSCPYNAISGFAIDPVYIAVDRVPEVRNSFAAQDFITKMRPVLNVWHSLENINFMGIRDAKLKVLWSAFLHFLEHEEQNKTPRAEKFREFCLKHDKEWLHYYALFRTFKDKYEWQNWTDWPQEYKNAEPEALIKFAQDYPVQIGFYKYIQWLAEEQIEEVRLSVKLAGIKIFGDIPFSLSKDSADVWAERENFLTEEEVGAPPDQFSSETQKWGLVAYNWGFMHSNRLDMWRRKIKRVCNLYDICRLDHVVGFFRTYVYFPDGRQGYDITDEFHQEARGKSFLIMAKEAMNPAITVGEDLGLIPNYSRRIMWDLQIPGYKIVRWETDNGYYREPRNYPHLSIAALSTHDTEPLRLWWENMPADERRNVWEMFSAEKTDGIVQFTPHVRETILRRVLDSGSGLVMFSIQDILGTLDRINTPGTVSEQNWNYRLCYTPEELDEHYAEEMTSFRRLLEETGRITAKDPAQTAVVL